MVAVFALCCLSLSSLGLALASLANTTAFAAVTAEAAVGAGADSAEMRERAVQQNGSQRMSDASNQSLLSQHGHTMDESLGRPIAR